MDTNKQLFLSTKDAASYMGIAQTAFREVMQEHGVAPIDFGRGSCRGLRWKASEIIRVADALQAEANSKQFARSTRIPRRQSGLRKASPLWGKDPADIYAELTAPTQ